MRKNFSHTLTLRTALVTLCTVTFFAINAQPVINSFSPTSGPVGTTVTISGSNFSSTAANNIVYFGAVKANVTAATTTSLTVNVPAGATYTPFNVTTNNATAFSAKPFSVTFSGAASEFTSQSFQYASRIDSVSSSVETTKYSMGDIDNDGLIDIVTIDRLNNTMSVYKNTTANGIISFAQKIDFTTNQSPRAVTVADVDGDGKLDVVVSNFNANTVAVYKNTTSGGIISFASKVEFSTATQPAVISVTDLDKDGKLDLVVNTVNIDGFVSVLRNTSTGGTISFAPKIDLQSVGGSIEEIRTADFDGDGKPDIALPNFFAGTITIFRNTSTVGSLSFAPKTDIPNGGSLPSLIEIGDFNDDGKPDIALRLNSSYCRLFRNTSTTGNISFNFDASNWIAGSKVDGICINDFDGDGKPDLALNNGVDQAILYKNGSSSGGNISFTSSVLYQFPWNYPVLSADFDNDGKPDLAYRSGIYRVTIWKNCVTKPQVISFSPTKAGQGNTVTISGFNFSDVNKVSFGEVSASSFAIVNSNTITAVVGTGATGDVKVNTPADSGSLSGFVFLGPPLVLSFTPTSATTNDMVEIKGQNFNEATDVKLGGISASFTIVDPNTIDAYVGTGATGSVSVTTPAGTSSLPGFTYIPKPLITSFTPNPGFNNSVITIKGLNFTGTTSVSFGGTPAASFTIVDSVTITAVINNGSSGDISVESNRGNTSLAGFTFIPPPVITSVSPTVIGPGAEVTIIGANLLPTTSITFGGVQASSFTVIAADTVKAIVGSGTTGYINLTTSKYSTSSSWMEFINTPHIYRISPTIGPVGTTVTISGINFQPGAVNNAVYFGGVRASIVSATANKVIVTVPAGAGYKPITVTSLTTHLTAASDQRFTVTFPVDPNAFDQNSFAGKTDFTTGSAPYDVKHTDIDGDGKPDMVIINNGSTFISIYRNLSVPGRLTFSSRIDKEIGFNAKAIAIADMDGDGKQDLVISSAGSTPKIYIFRNQSTPGNISFIKAYEIGGMYNNAGFIETADFDLDGRMDIVYLCTECAVDNGGIYVVQNQSSNGTLSFPTPTLWNFGNPFYNRGVTSGMTVSDVNNDGKPDVIVGLYQASSLYVFKNTTNLGQFIFFTVNLIGYDPYLYDGYDSYTPFTGNFSSPDVSDFASSKYVYKNSNGSFSQLLQTSAIAVNVCDLNGDGKQDIIGRDIGYNNFSLIKNISDVNGVAFAPAYKMDFAPDRITTIGDLDGDSKPEICLVYTGLNIVRVLRNRMNEATPPPPTIISFVATVAGYGDQVIITGTNFNETTNVSFGGTPALSFTIVSQDSIIAVVGTGNSGAVTVTTTGGTASKDGFIYSATAVNDPLYQDNKQLFLYPNPTRDIVNIKHPATVNAAQIKIVNISGKVVLQANVQRNTKQTSLLIKNIPSGMYEVIWISEKGILRKNLVIIAH